jgi:hypothetical protein
MFHQNLNAGKTDAEPMDKRHQIDSSHQFLIKVFGEFAYRLVRWAPDHLQQYCENYHDIDADGSSYIDRWRKADKS